MVDETAGEIALKVRAAELAPGLYLVATPIGTARDITLRALDVLNNAEVLAAEDTRTLRHLMDIHGIPLRGRRIVAYHDHNEDRQMPGLLQALAEGRSVAYASDAGTPLVADPGYRLGRMAAEQGSAVHAVPGPSAALAALTVSGLPSDRFMFAGFPPSPMGQRRSWLNGILKIESTMILFESPRRVKQTLEVVCETEPERQVVICRELTKRFEEVLRGTASELVAQIPDQGLKGEVVILIGPPKAQAVGEDAVLKALAQCPANMSMRDAANDVAQRLGLPKRQVYQLALAARKDE